MSSDSNSNSNSSNSSPSSDSSSSSASPSVKPSFVFTSPNSQRRVCSVVRWLQQGFGFAIDLGRLDTSSTPNTGYGWVADENTGTHIFVEHRALICDEGTFHRLFANEFIECSVDFSLPRDKGRSKAYDVTGIAGRKLLCDYRQEAADNANGNSNGTRYSGNNQAPSSSNGAPRESRETRQPRQTTRQDRSSSQGEQPRRSRSTNRQNYNQNNRSSQGEPRPTTVQYIYYGTAAPPQGAPSPADLSGLQFPALPVQPSEPSYITPTSGIPVPK